MSVIPHQPAHADCRLFVGAGKQPRKRLALIQSRPRPSPLPSPRPGGSYANFQDGSISRRYFTVWPYRLATYLPPQTTMIARKTMSVIEARVPSCRQFACNKMPISIQKTAHTEMPKRDQPTN